MQKSTNFELNVPEGSDKFAPLSDFNPNWNKIDSQMKLNEDNSIPTATEAVAGTVHNIIRNKPDAAMFRFTATGDVKDGDTFTVDGVSMQAVLPNGQGVTAGTYLVNSQVLACVVGGQLTIYSSGGAGGGTIDADTLDGHDASYFATKTEVDNATTIATAARTVADNAKSTADQALEAAQGAGFTMTELWSNPSPTDPFPAQQVDINKLPATAKMIAVGYAHSMSGQGLPDLPLVLIPVVESSTIQVNGGGFWWANGATQEYHRSCLLNATAKTLYFYAGHYNVNETAEACIPMKVYALS